jgi:hypothetical protein
MSAMSENAPSLALTAAGARCGWQAIVSRTRLVLAMAATVVLPYAYGRELVTYSQYRVIEPRFLVMLLIATPAIMLLTLGLAPQFSRRTAWIAFGIVFAIWSAFYAFLVFAYNGDQAPAWLVFAGFFPATLWILWMA